MKPLLFLSVLVSLVSSVAQAQTCCSGGVPVSNSLGLVPADDSGFLINFSFDHHNLNNLYNSSERVKDNRRQRITDSYVLQVGKAVNRFTFELLVPFVSQKRLITGIGTDQESSKGFGDLAFLAGRQFGKSKNWHLAVGLKLPTGKISSTSDLGIKLNADMQSGTGSLDGLFTALYAKQFQNRTFYMQIYHTERGTKKNFETNLDYRFGNESQMTLGVVSQKVFFQQLMDFGLASRLRIVGRNFANGQEVPGTGGRWVLLNGMARVYFFDGSTSLQFSGDLPLLHRVNGLQNVPTYRANIGLMANIKSKEK
ncbi:hypothetical protein [Jiulongibacter sp. NS-SX5]|uniref:hypothetical protein n=1 Tax=Jiulongibacter sp. NS-SX5 TaxID=3463854 RepID=UPI00405910A0